MAALAAAVQALLRAQALLRVQALLWAQVLQQLLGSPLAQVPVQKRVLESRHLRQVQEVRQVRQVDERNPSSFGYPTSASQRSHKGLDTSQPVQTVFGLKS